MACQVGTTGPSTIARTKTQSAAEVPWTFPLSLSFVTFLCQNIPPWASALSSGHLYDSDIPHRPVSHYSPCELVIPIRFVDTPSSPHVFIFTIYINSILYSCCWIHYQVDQFLFPFERFSSLHIVGFWPFPFYPSIADIDKTFLWEFADFNFWSSRVYLTLGSSQDDIFELPIDWMYSVKPSSHCWCFLYF